MGFRKTNFPFLPIWYIFQFVIAHLFFLSFLSICCFVDLVCFLVFSIVLSSFNVYQTMSHNFYPYQARPMLVLKNEKNKFSLIA
jgi:hypothetical protein